MYQAVTCILTSSNITTWLSAEEVTYSFIAAVCHDLDHPGNSNLLEKNSRTAIAEKFTISPLENHHRELACDRDGVLDEFHILANVDHASKQIIKDGVASLILATDMAKHADKTGKLRKLLDGGVEAVRGVRTDAGAKCLVLQNVMKCADISNQARVKVAADFWNAAIYEEFYAEGDRDRREGRKVNPLHDRFTNVVPKSSVGFGNFVVLPMFALIRDFLTLAASIDNGIATATIDHAVSLLKQNTASYAAEAKRVAEQKKTKSTIPERVHDSGKLKGDQQKGEPVSDKNIDHRPGSDDEEPKKKKKIATEVSGTAAPERNSQPGSLGSCP